MIPLNREVNTVTEEEWITATSVEQRAFRQYWHSKGYGWFSCRRCGYPTSHGTVGCDACRQIESPWEKRQAEEAKAKRQCPQCKGRGEVEK
jgi:hypothetical protein